MKRFFRQNHQITAQQVRVIDDEGKQVGLLTLSEALLKAQEAEKDLVEIAPDAKPPVVKIVDFKKFKYLEEKKEKEARKHAKATELKEVRFSPFIGEHDLNTALKRVREFLGDGDMVKISVVFKGRQMAHQEFGPKMLDKIMASLEGMAEQERMARFEGRRYVTVVRPTKGTVKPETQTKNKQSFSTNENKDEEGSSQTV